MALVEAIVPVFTVILLGWAARKFNFISEKATSILNSFAFYFALPALFFTAIYMINFNVLLNAKLLLSVILPMLIVAVIAYLYAVFTKRDDKTKVAYVLGSFLGQNAYLAIPFISLAYGVSFEPMTALVGAIYFSVGMGLNLFILEYYSTKRPQIVKPIVNVLKTPTIWGILFALGFSILATYYGVKMPLFLRNTLTMVAAPASAVALFALGTFLHKKSKIDLKEVLTLCFFKNLLLPIISVAVIALLAFESIDTKVIILQAAMPMAITNFVLSEQYNVRKELISTSIVVSTIISLVTLSLLTFVL